MLINNPEIITVVTSLDKHNIEKQLPILENWKQCGFSIISVNSTVDINKLGGLFPGVAFVIDRNAICDPTGRYFVQLDSMISVLKNTKGRVCGIVNPNVVFEKNVLPLICQEAIGAIVFGAQYTKANFNNSIEPIYSEVFDFFFFEKSSIADYPSSHFLFGVSWWDCWTLLHPIIRNQQIKCLSSPMNYYQKNNVNENNKKGFVEFGRIIAQSFRSKIAVNGKNVEEYYQNILKYIFDHAIEIRDEN